MILPIVPAQEDLQVNLKTRNDPMKLEDYRKTYYEFSGIASTVSRQAAFAGIALIWIFSNKSGPNISLPNGLLWPAYFLIIGLAFDLLQYIVAAAIWGIFHRIKEHKLGVDYVGDITAPTYLNWPTLVFFWGKVVAILIGYFLLFAFVSRGISFT